MEEFVWENYVPRPPVTAVSEFAKILENHNPGTKNLLSLVANSTAFL
jgi:hypothetical protein